MVNTHTGWLPIFTKSIVSTQLSFIFTSSDITNLPCLLVSLFYSYSQRASFPRNCRLSLLVQISTDLAYHSSISILISFCYLTVVRLYQFRYLRIWHVLAVSTFWSVSVTHIHKHHRFHLTVVHFYQFRYLRIWHTLAVQAFWSISVTHIHKEHRFHTTVLHLYWVRYLRIWHASAVLAFWFASVTH